MKREIESTDRQIDTLVYALSPNGDNNMGCPLMKLESLKERNSTRRIIFLIAGISAGMIMEEKIKKIESSQGYSGTLNRQNRCAFAVSRHNRKK